MDFEGELNVALGGLVDLVDALLEAGLELADAETEDEVFEVLHMLALKLPDIFPRCKDEIPAVVGGPEWDALDAIAVVKTP